MNQRDTERETRRREARKSQSLRSADDLRADARQDALHDSLTNLIVVPEDAENFQSRAKRFYQAHRPQNEWQSYLSEQIAMLSLRVDRAQRIERKQRDKIAWRALACWDDDQRLRVERLGKKLRKDPAVIVLELRATPHGCDWMIQRWGMLAAIADQQPWGKPQSELAYDLQGTPTELRILRIGTSIDVLGNVDDASRAEAEIARDAIADLLIQRDQASKSDSIDRSLTQADLSEEDHPELKRIRRLEAGLQRQIRWLTCQIQLKPETARPRDCYKPEYFFNPPESAGDDDLATPIGFPAPRSEDEAHNAIFYEARFAQQAADEESTVEPLPPDGTNPTDDDDDGEYLGVEASWASAKLDDEDGLFSIDWAESLTPASVQRNQVEGHRESARALTRS